jgi:hypothetical protein
MLFLNCYNATFDFKSSVTVNWVFSITLYFNLDLGFHQEWEGPGAFYLGLCACPIEYMKQCYYLVNL